MSSAETLPIIALGVVILSGFVLGTFFRRIGHSSSLGYILAGLVLGPLGFNYLAGTQGVATTTMLGEIGVTMLLFYLGLELSVKHFKESGAIATVLAFVEMLFA
ncbi:MAG: cation:proton antiporter, partial [Candidatus Micrarchaeota archaeon]